MSNSQDKPFLALADLQGLALFAIGSLGALSIGMWVREGDIDSWVPGAEVIVVGLLIGGLGVAASLVLACGAAAVGAMRFLGAREGSLANRFGIVAALAVVVSLVAGFASEGAGGQLGRAVAGALAGPVGLIAGLVLLVTLAVVAVWVTGAGRRRAKSPNPGEGDSVAAALRREEWEGVSAQEAEALVPDLPDPAPSPSPTSIDVRRQGGIPKGARPLGELHAPSQLEGTHPAAAVQPAPVQADRERREPADPDLAAGGAAAPEAPAAGRKETEGEARGAVAPAAARPRPAAVRELEPRSPVTPSWERAGETKDAAPASEPAPTSEPSAAPAPGEAEPAAASASAAEDTGLPPGWDQPSLFEEGENGAGTLTAEERAAEYAEPAAAEPPIETEEPAPLEADEDAEEEAGELVSELEEEPADDEGREDEDEDDDYEYEDDDDEDEYEDDDDEDEDEEYDDEDDEDDEDEEDEEDEEEDDDYDEEDSLAASAASEPEEEPEEVPVSQEAAALKETVLKPEPPAPARSAKAASRKAPVKKKAAKRSTKKPAAKRAQAVPGDREQLVFDAGRVILEHERVAVSLLQREFDLDFQGATELLDELQDRGLIGPYIGGTSRDILMSMADWIETAPTR